MSSVPLYCPFWGADCRWSADTSSGTTRKHLETHLRIVHPGREVPVEPAVVLAAPKTKSAPWTVELVTAAIQARASELGHPPTSDHMPGGMVFACHRLFGGWASAVEAAGFEKPTRATSYAKKRDPKPPANPPGRPRKITAQDCIDALQAAASELGHPPAQNWWKREHRAPSKTILFRELGGSWSEALKAAGLTPAPETPSPTAVAPAARVAAPIGEAGALTAYLRERCSTPDLRVMLADALARQEQHLRIADQAAAEADVLRVALREAA